jgi:hypothetical protein
LQASKLLSAPFDLNVGLSCSVCSFCSGGGGCSSFCSGGGGGGGGGGGRKSIFVGFAITISRAVVVQRSHISVPVAVFLPFAFVSCTGFHSFALFHKLIVGLR